MNPSRELDLLIGLKVVPFEYDTLTLKCPHCGHQEPDYVELAMERVEPFRIKCTRIVDLEKNYPCDWRYYSPPPYSTEIAAAWKVVEKAAEGQFIEVYNAVLDPQAKEMDWNCRIGKNGEFEASAKTAPHAICLAALKACGVEV
jgi:hypothetical protein